MSDARAKVARRGLLNELDIIAQSDVEYEDDAPEIRIGTWYWVKLDEEDKDRFRDENEEGESLWCIQHIGSNYIHFKNVYDNTWRIHFDDFLMKCRYEPDALHHIRKMQKEAREEVRLKLGEIEELSRRLGVSPRQQITGGSPNQGRAENALVPISGTENIQDYKNELVRAKEEKLPQLFKELKDLHEELASWSKADLLPLEAEAEKFGEATGAVKERIFHVELYAGLIEESVLVRKGEPAPQGTKIHLMQRRHYMDEECLLDYRAGGMDFKKIGEFDRWISKKSNFERIFPHPRCVVAFRVRRITKRYEATCLSDFIKFTQWDSWNKQTFLYVRNGERLYRLDTEIDFGERLFPYIEDFKKKDKLWADVWSGGRVTKVVTDRERSAVIQEYEENKKKHEEWCEKWVGKKVREGVPTRCKVIEFGSGKKKERRYHEGDSPWYFSGTSHHEGYKYQGLKEVNKDNVYYDDVMEYLDEQAKEYNRIVLVLQGLLDRSEVFHPHEPIRLWKPEHFQENIELVFDVDKALYSGEKPDFEAYRARLNASLKKGSHTVGQRDFWLKKEAEKENERQAQDWRIKDPIRYKKFEPFGNPGPSEIAEVVRYMPRAKKCGFEWERDRLTYNDSYWDERKSNKIRCTLTVPNDRLLNVDAYQTGDYKQFFEDPRTREEYLKWAPLLLAAEDFKAGNKKGKKDER